jgi:hypothetical protein
MRMAFSSLMKGSFFGAMIGVSKRESKDLSTDPNVASLLAKFLFVFASLVYVLRLTSESLVEFQVCSFRRLTYCWLR